LTIPLGTSLSALVLVAAFLYAAYRDVRSREVGDAVWLLAALAGAAIGAVELAPSGPVALGCWALTAAFVVEHLVPWDAPLEARSESLPGIIELAIYAGVGVTLLLVGLDRGVGGSGLPVAVLATFVSVLFARALFEFGVLYGGADAKAVMVAALVLPLDATPLLSLPASAVPILSIYPFAFTLLMDAAVFAIAIPLALAVRNVRAGTFEFPRGFTSYRLPVEELPHRFVWLRDPALSRDVEEEESIETSEEDRRMRERQAATLRERGVSTVWVTPQLPFVVLLAAGVVAGLVAGNLLFDLFALL